MSDHGRGGTVLNRTGVGPEEEPLTLISGLSSLGLWCHAQGDIGGHRETARLLLLAQQMLEALKATLTGQHYERCAYGLIGGPPDDGGEWRHARCSDLCVQVRAAIAAAGEGEARC